MRTFSESHLYSKLKKKNRFWQGNPNIIFLGHVPGFKVMISRSGVEQMFCEHKKVS